MELPGRSGWNSGGGPNPGTIRGSLPHGNCATLWIAAQKSASQVMVVVVMAVMVMAMVVAEGKIKLGIIWCGNAV